VYITLPPAKAGGEPVLHGAFTAAGSLLRGAAQGVAHAAVEIRHRQQGVQAQKAILRRRRFLAPMWMLSGKLPHVAIFYELLAI
jgi:hypothetical protein